MSLAPKRYRKKSHFRSPSLTLLEIRVSIEVKVTVVYPGKLSNLVVPYFSEIRFLQTSNRKPDEKKFHRKVIHVGLDSGQRGRRRLGENLRARENNYVMSLNTMKLSN